MPKRSSDRTQSSKNLSRHQRDQSRNAVPAEHRPPNRVFQFFRRVGFSREQWGMIVLCTFLLLYIAGYAHVVPEVNVDVEKLPEIEAVRPAATPPKEYLLTPPLKVGENTLPGAILSESGKFDPEHTGEKKARDANVLPGAIGSDGSFDEYKASLLHDSSKEGGKAEKPGGEAGAKSGDGVEKKEEAVEAVKDETAKKKKKKKRKKKKRRKKKKSKESSVGSSSETSEESSSGTAKANEKGKSESKSSSLENASAVKELEAAAGKANGTESSDGSASGATEEMFDGPHPMNRRMEDLQVPDDGKPLDKEIVRNSYLKLAQAYLAPFSKGIVRRRFFEVLRRRTYSLSPPGSNKGIQTLLFQLIDKKVYLLDPYEVAKNSKPFYKTRIEELIWLLSEIAKSGTTPDTEFLVAIHDCVQTVNREHDYRGAVFKESHPTFTIVSCNFSDNIPFPMWEGDPVRGGLRSWDKKMETYRTLDTTPWEKKEAKAVFRGGNRPSMYFKTKKDANAHCDDAGRTRLAYLAREHAGLFNVGVSGKCGGKTYELEHLTEEGHHAFKYILYAEGNCFWADRLNKQVFGPSAIIKQETPCGQFWEPLLRPFTHYIPTDFFFQDTVEQIKWASENDEKVQGIVKKANEFALNFLSYDGIKTYVEVLLLEYSKLLNTKEINPEKGGVDVTV